MGRCKKILEKVFCLPPLTTVLVTVPSFALAIVVLETKAFPAVSYLAYLLSAYALILTIAEFCRMIKAARNSFDQVLLLQKIRRSPLGRRLLEDVIFRSEVTLQGGFLVNLLYVGLNLFYGARYRSSWFTALAVYYGLLCAMRGLLMCYVHRNRLAENLPSEFRQCRRCGILLLFMNLALAGMIVYMVCQNRGFSYPGLSIYVVAVYTFYITIAAVVNVVRFRRYKSPLILAAKMINLAAAMVSMLSLEDAMIAEFGEEEHAFRQMMTITFGGVICMTVLGMAILMIVRANSALRKFQSGQTHWL